MHMRLAVGIVTYNTAAADLSRFVRAFTLAMKELESLAQTEVLLFCLDNGAPSQLSALHPAVIQLKTEGNVGYTRAMNRIMKEAFDVHGADALITANPDGAFHHGALKEFVTQHQCHPNSLLEARQFPEEHAKIYNP